MGQTNVGGVRSQLNDRVALVTSTYLRPNSRRTAAFSPQPKVRKASQYSTLAAKWDWKAAKGTTIWQYDASNASCTRFVVVPRTGFFHPIEGADEERSNEGPMLSNLRGCRWTIPDGIQPIKDNWKRDSGELEIGGDSMEWTGKVVFYERWAQDDAGRSIQSGPPPIIGIQSV